MKNGENGLNGYNRLNGDLLSSDSRSVNKKGDSQASKQIARLEKLGKSIALGNVS
jgi:hypothetical protein